MNWKEEIDAARTRIAPWVRRTPVERSERLEKGTGKVFFKLENMQITGSFKARGALSKLTALSPAQRGNGVIAASSGNHGAAVAFGARELGCSAAVCVPHGAAPSKVSAIEVFGAEVEHAGEDCVETEAHARQRATEEGRTYISPYNDATVIAGQGTIGPELLEDIPELDAVFVSVGGGGMIGGIGAYLKAIRPETQIIAVSPEKSPALHRCIEAGEVIDVPCYPTLSDATAGGVEENAVTLPLCKEVVDRGILVGEKGIEDATRWIIATHHMMVEGAAGLALAGFLQVQEEFRDKTVAIILCGANLGVESLRDLLKRGTSKN